VFFDGPGKCKFTETYAPTTNTGSLASLTFDVCPLVLGPPCVHPSYDLVGNGLTVAATNTRAIDFGNVTVGKSKTKTVTATVDAGFRMYGVLVDGAITLQTTQTGNCDFSFNGPGKCSEALTFAPTTSGLVSGYAVVAECPIAVGLCLNIEVDLHGTGV
jgi:hypothetical protein